MNKFSVVVNEYPADAGDMYGDLPPLDPLFVKLDQLAADLCALASLSGKSRSCMAEELHWGKSHVSRVLSGKNNPTIKTIFSFAENLGYDFDVVFRGIHEPKALQPWHRQNIPVSVERDSPTFTHRDRSFRVLIQPANAVARDITDGTGSDYYASLVPKESGWRPTGPEILSDGASVSFVSPRYDRVDNAFISIKEREHGK